MSRLALLFLFSALPLTFAQSEEPEISLSEGKFLGLGTANGMAFSPDGKLVATAGSLGVVLWDSQTFEVVRVLEAPEYQGNNYDTYSRPVAFSPDGQFVISRRANNDLGSPFVFIWSTIHGQEVAQINGSYDISEENFGDIWGWLNYSDIPTTSKRLVNTEVPEKLIFKQNDDGVLQVSDSEKVLFVTAQETGITLTETKVLLVDELTGDTVFEITKPEQILAHGLIPDTSQEGTMLFEMNERRTILSYELDYRYASNCEGAATKCHIDFELSFDEVAAFSFKRNHFLLLTTSGNFQVWSLGEKYGFFQLLESKSLEPLFPIKFNDVEVWLNANSKEDTFSKANPLQSVDGAVNAYLEYNPYEDETALLKQLDTDEILCELGKLKDTVFDPQTSTLYKLLQEVQTEFHISAVQLPDCEVIYDMTESTEELGSYGSSLYFNSGSNQLGIIWHLRIGPDDYHPVYSEVMIYDATTGNNLGELEGFDDYVPEVAFSPNSKLIATSTWQGVNIWDATTGDLIRKLEDAQHATGDFQFSADNEWLVAFGGYTYVWNLNTGDLIASSKALPITGTVALNPITKQLALCDGTSVYLWEAERAKLTLLTTLGNSRYCDVTFSPDGKYLIAKSEKAQVFNTSDWSLLYETESIGNLVSPNSRYVSYDFQGIDYLYEGGDEPNFATVEVQDLVSGETVASLPHEFSITDLEFDATGRYVYSQGSDGVLLFDLETKKYLGKVANRNDEDTPVYIQGVFVLPNATWLGVAFSDGHLRFYKPANFGQLCYCENPLVDEQFAHTWDLTLSPDGKKLVSRAPDGLIKLWSIEIKEAAKKN